MSFLIFGLFWMVNDHAPLWVDFLFVLACLSEDERIKKWVAK